MSEAHAPAKAARHGVLPAGKVVGGRYRIGSVIGEGAHSVVYLAKREAEAPAGGDSPGSGARPAAGPVPQATEVALKVIHRHLCGDPQIFGRFRREARILGRLEGEHVAKLLDFVEDDGLLAIALERVEGVSLEALLAERRPLDLDVAIEIALQVCAALGAAHANDIVHRDLKPANVLVERPAGAGPAGSPSRPLIAAGIRVKVVDFGLGKLLHGETAADLTEQGMIFGTAEYMAPEQARGDEIDARADLYAAGVMLYEMLVGAPPFSGRTPLDVMSAHLAEPPRSPREARPGGSIPPALESVMLRALSKDPAERYESARDLAQAIASARAEPRVFAPARVSNPDVLAMVDTDLHLEPPSLLAQARTLKPDELAAMQKGVPAARLRVTAIPTSDVPSTLQSPGAAAPAEEEGAAPGAEAPRPAKGKAPIVRMEILDEETAVSGEAPRRMGWVWAVVAIVAAAVGVVIGVIVGTR